MSYNPYRQGMGDWFDNIFTPPTNTSSGGSDGEYAIPGNVGGNTLPSSGYVFITANGRTYSVNTPAGYNMWPEVSKRAWIAAQQAAMSGQGGTNIRSVQAALNNLPSSLARLSVDGVWGSKTSARVAEFQRMNGLPATGTLDATTQQRILSGASGGLFNRLGNAPASSNNNPAATNNLFGGSPQPQSSGGSSLLIYGALALIVVITMRD
jgi:hypothetical protein